MRGGNPKICFNLQCICLFHFIFWSCSLLCYKSTFWPEQWNMTKKSVTNWWFRGLNARSQISGTERDWGKCNCFCESVWWRCRERGGLFISPSGLHKMDKSVPKLNVLSILHKPPDINPSIHHHTFPPWIRADLLSGNLVVSWATVEALHLVAEFNYTIIWHETGTRFFPLSHCRKSTVKKKKRKKDH